MDYKKVYNQIIDNRKQNPISENEYGEWHHIIPRCLGGSDNQDNLIRLSAREHFICHSLLAEMYEYGTNEWYKMNHAFLMMKTSSENHGNNRYFNSRLYAYKKKDFSEVMSELQSGKLNSQYGKIWVYNLDKEKSIKIDNSDLEKYENKGWIQGRVMDFDKKRNDINKYEKRKKLKKERTYKGFHYNKVTRKTIKETFDINLDNNFEKNIIKFENLLKKLYIKNEMSTTDIASVYNSNNVFIRKCLMRLNISLRTHKEAYDVYKK